MNNISNYAMVEVDRWPSKRKIMIKYGTQLPFMFLIAELE